MKTKEYTLKDLLQIDNEDICLQAAYLLQQNYQMHSTWKIKLEQVD